MGRPDAFEKAIIGNFHGFAVERRLQPGAVQVEVDAVGAGYPGSLIRYLVLQVDGDARVDRGGPVTDSTDQRDLPGVQGLRSGGWSFGSCGSGRSRLNRRRSFDDGLLTRGWGGLLRFDGRGQHGAVDGRTSRGAAILVRMFFLLDRGQF